MSKPENSWVNPFSVDRVEDWRVEEHPENYKKIAALFAPPSFMEELENPEITKAIFIVGGRGSGKSHILKRISVQSEIKAIESACDRKLEWSDFRKNYFGVYIKTDCFSPLSEGNIPYIGENERGVLFEHLFNVEVCKAIVGAIKFFERHFDDNFKRKEGLICGNIKSYLEKLGWENNITSLDGFMELLEKEAACTANYTRKVLFDENIRKNPRLNFMPAPGFITKIYKIITDGAEPLKDKSLILLLDEYESLDKNQQKLINQIIKDRKVTLRIAVKVRGVKTLDTKTSELLEEIHDYYHVDLHFKLGAGAKTKYKNLAKQIFENRLSFKRDFGDYNQKDPKKLLPEAKLMDYGISAKEIDVELEKIRTSLRKEKSSTSEADSYLKNLEGHYKKAAIFRLLKSKGKAKVYAGFGEYVSLSSGIIRLFIWLCREAFTLAHQKNIEIKAGEPIDVHTQSQAATKVAKDELKITIPQTINSIYASKLSSFVHDLGQILRARVQYSTQPQANRFEIINSEKFELESYKIPRELIENGHDLPVLLTEQSFKPRDVKYPFPKTFSLNNIFVPLFDVPTEGRWRTELTSDEIKGLCLTENRAEVLEKIVNQIKGKKRKIRRKKKSEKEEDKNLGLFTKAITLANCPVTGIGCNRSLVESEKDKAIAFLATPFNEGWVSDPRDWFKEAMIEEGIVCKDIGDFAALGFFLCKICSCVRQFHFGVFEISELNPNVIFEFGMSIGLLKPSFIFVHTNKIPSKYKKEEFPPSPLTNIEYIPYDLSRASISGKIKSEIKPIIESGLDKFEKCRIIDAECPHMNVSVEKKNIFVALPCKNESIFDEVYKIINQDVSKLGFKSDRHQPAKSSSELCQICVSVRSSVACIIDTTYNDLSMLFALGVAFGRDRKFIQLHDVELSADRPISDLKTWAIEYKNTKDLESKLSDELKRRFVES